MSYDAYLFIDTGGKHSACVAELGNMTSNVSPMWTKALGFPLADLHERSGADCLPHLERAIESLGDPATRSEYEAMNPSNGWGDVASAEKFLKQILKGCRAHPKAALHLSY